MLKHGNNKRNFQKQIYLLFDLLWVEVGGRQYKMYGSTPSGRTKSYSYYLTHTKFENMSFRVQTKAIENQISGWLNGITIAPEIIPDIREIYKSQIRIVTNADKEENLDQLKRKLKLLKDEETNLGRLVITGKISEEAYDHLRVEWGEKTLNLRLKIEGLEFDARSYLDDLEVALALLANVSILYERLDEKQKNSLLRIPIKRNIINQESEIISHELHPPSYLKKSEKMRKGMVRSLSP